MEFKTSVSKITEDDMIVRGERLSELIKESTFSDTVFLILAKRKPTPKESRLFSALLTSIIDHGMGTASSMAARFVMSTGNPLNAAVAAGVLALGDLHGGAIENAMLQLLKLEKDLKEPGKANSAVKEFVTSCLAEKKVIYGYGHPVYKTEDPRVKHLLKLCKELDYESSYIMIAQEIEGELGKQKGKMICLNIDGFIAAVMLEMGFPPSVGKGIFIIGRTPGLVAQAMEEKQKEKPVRRVDEKDISYVPE